MEPGDGDDPGTPCEDNEADQSAGKGKTLVKTLEDYKQAWFEAKKKCSVVAMYWEQMAMMEEVSLGRP